MTATPKEPEIKWKCGLRKCPGIPAYAIRYHVDPQPVVLLCEDHKNEIVFEPYAERLGVACNVVTSEALGRWE